MRCPFCHNPENVLPERLQEMKPYMIDEEAFFAFLKTRKGLLDGVSICGGEPTIHRDLPQFAARIKDLGFSVKLDTNGSNVEMVASMIAEGVVEYVAVDIKHTPSKYGEASGVASTQRFRDSFDQLLELLKQDVVAYEYRTTVIDTLHTVEDIRAIAAYVQGIHHYYLQTFKRGNTLDPLFGGHAYSEEVMNELQKEVSPFVESCEIRW